MVGMSIWEKFEALESGRAGGTALPALLLPGAGTHYLAKGGAGEPVMLLTVQKRRVPRIPLGLRHVQVEFEVECTVSEGYGAVGSVTATFCRAACDPTAPGLHALFIHALVGAVEGLPSELSPGEVDRFFDDAVELFRSFSAPAKTSVLGLWGELLVIAASPCCDTFIMGWHVTPDQVFDFSFPATNLEVKTTARHNRQHEFSLTQLRGGHLPAIVASIVVEQSDAGENVFELASAIQEYVPTKNRAKLWRLVAQSVGNEADGAGDMRFIRAAALNSLRFYDAATLPAPDISISAATCISAVRFSLDLDRLQNVPLLDAGNVWQIVS
jgi:hypothetical protein